MHPPALSIPVLLLLAGQALPAQAPAEGGKRSGPRSGSYLRSLPMDSFVDSQSLQSLAELVVTDTKTPQPQEAATQVVEVLHEEAFAQQPDANRNLAELFQFSAGQFINVLSRNDPNWGSTAGLGPKYNGWLLDGLPVDAFTEGMALDAWAFERVERHKGPASVLYSNYLSMDFAGNQMPMAGTTNWILRNHVEGRATRFQLEGGSFGTRGARLYHQDRFDGGSAFAGASLETSDYTNYGTPDSWLQIRQNPDYRKTKLYGKVSLEPAGSGQVLSLFVNHARHEGNAGRPNRDFSHAYDTANLEYSNQVGEDLQVQFKTGYRGYERRWGEDMAPEGDALREHDGVRQRIIPSDLTFSLRQGPEGLLTLGLDHQAADFRTFVDASGARAVGNDVRASSLGIFVQEKWGTGPWVWRAGARLNESRQDLRLLSGHRPMEPHHLWRKALWSAGVRYGAPGGWALFANAGSSFVLPSALQIGGTLLDSQAGLPGMNGRLPNDGLRPERGLASDAGAQWRPVPGLEVTLRGFLNTIDDAIVDNVVSATPSQSRSVNAGRTRSMGGELSVEQVVGEHAQWFANVAWTRTRVSNPLDPDQDGAEVPFGPDHVASAGLTLDLPLGLTATLAAHRVGTYYDSTSKASRLPFGSTLTFSASLAGTLVRRQGYTLTLGLDMANVTDRRYRMPWQFQDPGRTSTASIQARF